MKALDAVDRVILGLPVLGFFDVLSTLYVQALGYSLEVYEVGFFASFFVIVGFTYFYAVVYLLTLGAFAYFLWFVKNKELNPLRVLDKLLFLFLVGVVCYICLKLTVVSVGNFLLPYFMTRTERIPRGSVIVFTYLSTAFALSLYLWRDIIKWVKTDENGREQ